MLRTDILFPKQQRKGRGGEGANFQQGFPQEAELITQLFLEVSTLYEQLFFARKEHMHREPKHAQREKTVSIARKSQRRDQHSFKLKLS